ncbi:MAG: hypothetical protein ABI384_07045 [Allobranchiibius sp.]|nr:hypothetical protein [Actinomycetota bacterium]
MPPEQPVGPALVVVVGDLEEPDAVLPGVLLQPANPRAAQEATAATPTKHARDRPARDGLDGTFR